MKKQLAITLALLLAFVVSSLYVYAQRNHDANSDAAKLDFTYMEPSKLPANIKITKRYLSVRQGYGPNAIAELSNGQHRGSINLQHYAQNNAGDVSTKLTNYDPQSKNVTCKQATTQQKTSYKLCHWVSGVTSIHELKFQLNDTFINAKLPLDIQAPLSEEDLNGLVDSFTAAAAPTETFSGI